MTSIDTITQFFTESEWIYRVFAAVFATLLLDLVWRKLFSVIFKKVSATQNQWDDAFFNAARLPVSLLIWLFGLSLSLQLTPQIGSSGFLSVVHQGREVLSVGIVAWFLVQFIQGIEQRVLLSNDTKKQTLDQTSLHAISKLLRISVLITAGLIILETLGYSIKGIMAFGGIGGIAVGFASKDLLANFFGGLMIFLDRPFALGDWIRSPDRAIEGTVEHIGWRLTRIRTFDQRPLYIPNSVFTSIAVENPSRMSNRRIYENIGICYDDAEKLPGIIEAVETMLKEHKAIDQSKILMVNFNAYGPSALDFFIYTFTKTTQWMTYHQVKQDVLFQILTIIKEHGASIAYPTQRLLMESNVPAVENKS